MKPTSLQRLFLVFVVALVALGSSRASESDADTLFAAANRDFEMGDFADANEKYLALVEDGYASPDLYFNLGTTLFREDRPGESMLWLRRARVLDGTLPEPRQSIRFLRTHLAFLEFAESRTDRFVLSLPGGLARWISLACFWLALIALALGFAIPRLAPNRSGFIALAVLLLPVAIVGHLIENYREQNLAPENFATVVAMNTSALTSPTPDAREVIDLPPGSEVRILQSTGPWRYVDIPGDLRGWVRADAVEPVWPIPDKSS